VGDSKTGDLIIKLANGANEPKPLRIALAGVKRLSATVKKTVLAGAHPAETNERLVQPQTSTMPVAPTFDSEAPANSLTVIRITP
jgi:hypothetical protein